MRPLPRASIALLAPLLVLPGLAGCLTGDGADATGGAKPLVLTSFYPVHFLATRIAGDNVTVETVTGQGVQPHGWEPAARDVGRVAKADLLLVQGLGFEAWLPRVLETLGTRAPPVVETTQGLSLLAASPDHHHDEDAHTGEEHDAHEDAEHDAHANETAEEHAAHANESDDDHDAHGEDDHAHEEEPEAPEPEPRNAFNGTGSPDPHTWLDPMRYAQQARNVQAALAEAFPEHADAFRARADALVAELEALDHAFEEGLASCNVSVVIVSHNAFSYLAERYGFDVLSVHGLSPDSEPDAQTVQRLVDAARAYGVPAVFMEELANPRVVQVIADEVGADVLVLSPVEGVAGNAPAGTDYFTIQEQNLQNLREGMHCL